MRPAHNGSPAQRAAMTTIKPRLRRALWDGRREGYAYGASRALTEQAAGDHASPKPMPSCGRRSSIACPCRAAEWPCAQPGGSIDQPHTTPALNCHADIRFIASYWPL